MHEVIQHYLSVFYGVSKKQANELDMDKMLLSKLKEEFLKEREKMSEGAPCEQIELEEFYGDGRRILEWFKKHVEKLNSHEDREQSASIHEVKPHADGKRGTIVKTHENPDEGEFVTHTRDKGSELKL
jgi:hypothetical protein